MALADAAVGIGTPAWETDVAVVAEV